MSLYLYINEVFFFSFWCNKVCFGRRRKRLRVWEDRSKARSRLGVGGRRALSALSGSCRWVRRWEQEQAQHWGGEGPSLFQAVALAVNGGWHLDHTYSDALGTLVLQRDKGRDGLQLREGRVSGENLLGVQASAA